MGSTTPSNSTGTPLVRAIDSLHSQHLCFVQKKFQFARPYPTQYKFQALIQKPPRDKPGSNMCYLKIYDTATVHHRNVPTPPSETGSLKRIGTTAHCASQFQPRQKFQRYTMVGGNQKLFRGLGELKRSHNLSHHHIPWYKHPPGWPRLYLSQNWTWRQIRFKAVQKLFKQNITSIRLGFVFSLESSINYFPNIKLLQKRSAK